MHIESLQDSHDRPDNSPKFRLFAHCLAGSICAGMLLVAPAHADSAAAEREEWITLFNGRNLDGWTPKITGHALGDNFADTFRVQDGTLQVRYDRYAKFNGQFGHLFYREPFSYYRLVVEYRFVGEQVSDPPGLWALSNSGVMLHSQDPKSMLRDQSFPISVEAQFLGGLSDGKSRPTVNMCSPGTQIVYQGSIYPEHCLNSTSATFDGEQWVRAEIVVLGAGEITHFANGKQVLQYTLPQFGGGEVTNFNPQAKPDGELVDHGYIALQSESHPIDFRKVELLPLIGCMDANASNYKRYYVKSAPASCTYGKSK